MVAAVTIALVLSGVETDVTADVIGPAVTIDYGIEDGAPTVRMAGSGSIQFALNNSASNSAQLLGYYAPGNANCRAGFGFDIAVRAYVTFGGSPIRQKFDGKLYVIDPVPGVNGPRVTYCVAYDVMYELARAKLIELTPAIDQTETQLLDAIVVASTVTPRATSFDAGLDTFPFAFGDLTPDTSVAQAIAKVNISSWGWIFVKGDGTLRYRNRHSIQTAAFTLDNSMIALVGPKDLSRVYDRVDITTHPVTPGATATEVIFAAANVVTVLAGQTVVIRAPYSDPANRQRPIGGKDFQDPPVSGTDWKANAAQNGSGADMTASVTVTATFWTSMVELTIENTDLTRDAYMVNTSGTPVLQVRGRGYYFGLPVLSQATSGAGSRPLAIDMYYQDSVNIADQLAMFVLQGNSNELTQLQEVTLKSGLDAATLAALIDLEPTDQIDVSEDVTGLAGVRAVVKRINLQIEPAGILTARLGLAPFQTGNMWILDDPILSILDETTYPTYA